MHNLEESSSQRSIRKIGERITCDLLANLQKSGMQIHMIQETEFTDGVVAAGEVVGGILLTGDQLLRVEELAVGTRADLIDHGRLQVDLRNSGHNKIAYVPAPAKKQGQAEDG